MRISPKKVNDIESLLLNFVAFIQNLLRCCVSVREGVSRTVQNCKKIKRNYCQAEVVIWATRCENHLPPSPTLKQEYLPK